MPELSRSPLGEGRSLSTRYNWKDISQPGAYVSETTNLLYRIPREAIVQGSPVIQTSDVGGFVRIDSDPFVHPSRAAMTALEEGLTLKFAQ